ncbi:Zinc finger, RING-type [Corchorus capsularis]|uniref:Zinc finger, RING-type n=1 Tax=Corchorus capsularis TaxID=210143 RepID=A0A1R3G2J7_COCAP|nr:Zinc finger, RING-type [Corchorus capsularis]
MGSSSSRLGSNPSRGRLNRRPKRRSGLSSLFICGGSSSRAPLEMEDYPADILVKPAEQCDLVTNMVQSPLEESTSICSMEARFSSTGTETGISAESSTTASGDSSIEGSSRDVETSNCRRCFTERMVSADYSRGESHRDSSTSASTSFKEQQSSDPVSVNLSTNEDAVSGLENANEGASQIRPEPSILSTQRLEDSHSRGIPIENQLGDVTTVHNPGSDSAPPASEPVTFHSLGGESIRETIPSGLGFLVSNRERGRGDGSVLHVDVVSISSNILSGSSADASNREARRNSRRLFWDAFSRRSSRRLNDSPSIFLSTDDSDDPGFHDRWLLDFSGDFFYDGAGGDSGYFSSRIHSLNERRRHSRSEIWERLRGGHDENSRRTTFCPSGLHPDGTCSCDSLLMTDESTARASISRIVMLAEALFEVLDEIHRQPVSLSLSMMSLPAPESVVDSFPLRSHKKVDAAEAGDEAQCYICLAEYEEEDKIRVLPCHHEFHMSCVDKWLKEIHGVCPLCRGDVRQGVESSVSNSEIPSL